MKRIDNFIRKANKTIDAINGTGDNIYTASEKKYYNS
jgi:hypothetical protein